MVEKWSQERINAWVRYVRTDEMSLEEWERKLKYNEKLIEDAKEAIGNLNTRIDVQKQELAEQGFYL